jgi:2-succinyl-5-enolpyruvyl-6-hydroxy-3-cyclohexene-1-carboxylate synthase
MNASESAPSCHEFVAGLAAAGVTVCFVSPGSRNTPITLALAASDAIQDLSVRDERSAGFMALGYGKATGRPAAVVCTSGSAATHYYPAVVEADQSAVPMIVLTADRPVSLRGTFAPQTMDQSFLYGTHVKASVEIDVRVAGTRAEGVAVVRTATDQIAGPVHVNLPFDEPLTPATLQPSDPVESVPRDTNRTTYSIDELIEDRRVLIVTGGFLGIDFPAHLDRYADALGAPVLGDAQSRPDGSTTIAGFDLLASAGELDRNPPDVVVRFGGLPTSKSLWQWLEHATVPQVLVHRSRLTDPLGSATHVIDKHPISVVSRMPEVRSDTDFLATWTTAGSVVGKVLANEFSGPHLTEPAIAHAIIKHSPADSVVFVGSSMPIRDVDTYSFARRDVAIIGNRGVNGIDGTISTALGCALSGHPTTVLLGDVAALHDVSALAEVAGSGAPLRVVVINNDGGGIFSFLSQRQSGVIPETLFEKHWGTPHGLALAPIAAAMELPARSIASVDGLHDVLSQPIRAELFEIHTDRDANVQHHRSIQTAVDSALGRRQ